MIFIKEKSHGFVLKVYIMGFQRCATDDCGGPSHKVLIYE